jgi:hypothetical protein
LLCGELECLAAPILEVRPVFAAVADSDNSRIWNEMCDRYERETGEVLK